MRSTYRPIFLVFSLAIFCGNVPAQPGHDLQEGNIDYPVPTPAAIYPLQSDAPALLEPGTVRNAAFAAGAAAVDSFSLRVGAEFAPFLIANSVNLSEYLSGRLMRVLLRTRISVAANIDWGRTFTSALGLRFMLHDDADLRADSLFEDWLLEQAHRFPDIETQCQDALNSKSCLTEALSRLPLMQGSIDSLRDVFKETHWNRSVFEIAGAAVYQADRDSKLAVRSYHLFTNIGLPLFVTNGQFVAGFSGSTGHTADHNAFERRGAIIARLYYGSARERVFLESKLDAASGRRPGYDAGIGGIIGVANGLWLKLDVGLTVAGRRTGSYANVVVAFGTPEIR